MKGEIIKKMAECGVNLFRLNLSHTMPNDIEKNIKIIKANTDVPICLDSEGAQIRTQEIKGGSADLQENSIVKLHYDAVIGNAENISFSPEGVASQFEVNDIIKIDFNLASVKIIEKGKSCCFGKVITPGVIGSNKAIDVNREIPLQSITAKDRHAIAIGKEMGIKNYALSFANSSSDVLEFKMLTGKEANIISKIESRQGLMNLKDILAESDAILIDRGDLSRQIQVEKIPFLQRRIISIARIMERPVYVATNLLESMIKSKVPTRAEVNDVVSTILMGADGLVLAAETAIGENPVHAVEMIRNIISLCGKWTVNTNINEVMDM
jgi:pyruvate kinase